MFVLKFTTELSKRKGSTLEKKLKNLCLFLTLLMFGSFSAYAAVNNPNETAGAEQNRFEKQIEVEEKTKTVSAKPGTDAGLEEADEDESSADSSVRFILKSVKLTGNDSIPTSEFEPLYSGSLNKEVSLRDLRKIAKNVKQEYRSRGFIAAYVYLPPQNVTSGAVEIAIIEGRIGQIEITGNKWFSTKLIRRMLGISANNILYFDDLREGLNFLNKHRDIKAKSVLKPGKEVKTTDLEVNVKDKFPVHLSTDVNNLGTDNTGRTRWGLGVTHTNLLGLMDELSGRFQIGAHSWAAGANYAVPLNSYQTALALSYSHSSVDLGGDFKALNVEGRADTYGVSLIQPFLDTQRFNAGANVGFDFKSVKNKVNGVKAGVDELRILNLGLNLEENDSYGRTILPQSFHVGFADFLGASGKSEPAATRAGTGGQFFIYRSSLLRYTRLPAGLILANRGNLQLTDDSLPPSEQIRLGGAYSIRGYQEGEYLADNGAYLANEIYVPTYFFPKDWKLPYSSKTLRNQIMGVGFFDFGGGSLRKPQNTENADRFLAGIGGGVRIELFDRVYARFQWGAPIGSNPNDGTKGTFYYGISSDIF